MNTKRNYLLLTPGPLSTSETVREAMLQDWCTWDKDYNEGIVTPIRKGLLAIAGLDEDEYTDVLLQGSGTYCVEATIGAAVKPTDKLLILANGAYGKRMAQIAEYYHIDHVLVSLHETELVTGEVARKALEANPDITHLSMVHSETTTGLLNPIEEVAEVLKGRNITFIVDAMSSFGGVPIDMKKLDIDFLVSSANKCIQGVPGFGFIIAKKDKLIATKGNARSLSLDIYAQWETMEKGGGKWRFTSPTHVVHAFYQAMKELNEEYPNYNTVGETWVTEPAYTAWWQKYSKLSAPKNSNLKTVMDFSFYDKINIARIPVLSLPAAQWNNTAPSESATTSKAFLISFPPLRSIKRYMRCSVLVSTTLLFTTSSCSSFVVPISEQLI